LFINILSQVSGQARYNSSASPRRILSPWEPRIFSSHPDENSSNTREPEDTTSPRSWWRGDNLKDTRPSTKPMLNQNTKMVERRMKKVQFNVEMSCEGCAKAVRNVLQGVEGVEDIVTDVANGEVQVTSSLPAEKLLQLIRTTGKKASIHGYGIGGTEYGTAVSIIEGNNNVKGVVRFVQVEENKCSVEATISGLSAGKKHGLHVHEYGDISEGDATVGDHWNPYNKKHGTVYDTEKHAGDLGNVVVDHNGDATLVVESDALKVRDIIGRSVVLKEGEDDLGRGGNEESERSGNAGRGIAFGIVARSAGFGENRKKVCLCDDKNF
jgi:copper chaperone for superoxide dismutase